jgi:hypothetical protein
MTKIITPTSVYRAVLADCAKAGETDIHFQGDFSKVGMNFLPAVFTSRAAIDMSLATLGGIIWGSLQNADIAGGTWTGAVNGGPWTNVTLKKGHFPGGYINLANSSGVTIEGNEFEDHRGILVQKSANVTIQGNMVMRSPTDGINCADIVGLDLINNSVINTERGSSVHPDGIQLWGTCSKVRVIGNSVFGPETQGIFNCGKIDDVEVRDNLVCVGYKQSLSFPNSSNVRFGGNAQYTFPGTGHTPIADFRNSAGPPTDLGGNTVNGRPLGQADIMLSKAA